MSFYNKNLNALFIHVPKTAGTSIKRTHMFPGGTHQTIQEFVVPEDAFKFAFVRNPWDRLVSCFFFHKEYRGTGPEEFDKFIKRECALAIANNTYPHDDRPHAFVPMWHYLLDKDGNIGVDYIGRFENLLDDWQTVCDKIGKYKPLGHARKFKHDPYKSYYTPDTWDIVGELYQRDIELFGYESEL